MAEDVSETLPADSLTEAILTPYYLTSFFIWRSGLALTWLVAVPLSDSWHCSRSIVSQKSKSESHFFLLQAVVAAAAPVRPSQDDAMKAKSMASLYCTSIMNFYSIECQWLHLSSGCSGCYGYGWRWFWEVASWFIDRGRQPFIFIWIMDRAWLSDLSCCSTFRLLAFLLASGSCSSCAPIPRWCNEGKEHGQSLRLCCASSNFYFYTSTYYYSIIKLWIMNFYASARSHLQS